MTGVVGNGKRYFSHDSDAFFDSRIVKMRTKLGVAGYGAYWMIVERLRTSENYMHECDYDVFACLANADAELFRAVVEDHDLFEFVENDGRRYFYSKSLKRRMTKMEDIIEKRREAGRKGAEARWQKDDTTNDLLDKDDGNFMASAITNACDCYGNEMAKNGKLNKTKLNKTKLNKTKLNKTKDKHIMVENDSMKTLKPDTLPDSLDDTSRERGKSDATKTSKVTQSKTFIELPLNDGSCHGVTFEDLDKYKELYLAVNVEQELRAMVGWLDANPARRKTRRGVKSFITGWLNRSQDSGKGYNQRGQSQPERERIKDDSEYEHETNAQNSPYFQAWYAEEQAKRERETREVTA